LNSDDPDVYDDERTPIYDAFKMNQLTNNYVFKVGMDFKSLIEFKDAISEWLY
jgi:hypothetical protein